MTLRNCRRWCVAGACWLVALLAINSSLLAADEYPVLAEWTQGKRVEAETPAHAFIEQDGVTVLVSGEAEVGDGYWIGIYPRIVNEGEGEKQGEREPRGVVVSRVIPASPAAKAKLAEGDIIVQAGDKEINFLDELSEIVKNSEGKPLKLDVLRNGQVMQVEVTPEKRVGRPGMLFFGGKGKALERGQEGEGARIIISEEEEGEGLTFVIPEAGEREPGYWIGISPQAIDKELAEKLEVEPGQGVLVNQVMPESPAAKATLMVGDIILTAGDKKLSETAQLADIVRGSEGKEIQLKVRRGDTVLNLEVRPAKQGERRKMLFFKEEGEERGEKGEERGEKGEAHEKLEGMLRKLRELQIEQAAGRTGKQGPGQPGRLGIIQRPQLPMQGMAMPSGPMPSGLPDDMQVTIQKRGNKPAKVTVKQGEKLWQTTESELGMLPPQALGYVARMLGRPMMPGMGGFGMAGASGFTATGTVGPVAPGGAGAGSPWSRANVAPGTATLAVPGTPVPGQPQRFEIRLGEDGKAQVIQGQGILRAENEGSGEGIRIKIREAGEGEGKSPEQGNIKWFELKRPERPQATAEKNDRDIEIFELQELIQKLRLQLEERDKERDEEKPRLQKKGRNKEKKVREKGEQE